MCKNEKPQIVKRWLIGALIGLARATEGNVNRPTEETDKAFVKGMRMCFSDKDCSLQKILIQVKMLHEEKKKLVPHCLECALPCGRNNDFDIAQLNGMQSSQLRYALLSGLFNMTSFSTFSDENSSVDHIMMEFLYKAFFFIGFDCDEKSLLPLFEELGECQSNLYSQYFQPDSDK